MHENYFTPLPESNDIALLKLVSPADLDEGVGLVCLPDTDNDLPIDNLDKKCWTTGWGSLYHGGPPPNALMQASVPLVSNNVAIMLILIESTIPCSVLVEMKEVLMPAKVIVGGPWCAKFMVGGISRVSPAGVTDVPFRLSMECMPKCETLYRGYQET